MSDFFSFFPLTVPLVLVIVLSNDANKAHLNVIEPERNANKT